MTRFEEFAEKWGMPYPAIKRVWDAWSEFVPFWTTTSRSVG
jgi:putative transposase